jgi:hypothetical protein
MEVHKIGQLATKFQAFLANVSLQSQIKKRNLYGQAYGANCAFLQWDDEPIADAIAATRRLCPQISDKLIKNSLRDLMVKLLEDAISEKAHLEAIADLPSIADVLDTTDLETKLIELVESLRAHALPQIVYVPIEGLELKTDRLHVGTVTLHNRDQEEELDVFLESLKSRIGGDLLYVIKELESAKSYATLETKGDNDFVRAEAVQRVTDAIHILNLYLSSSLCQPYWTSIRIARTIFNRGITDDPNDVPFGIRRLNPSGRTLELDPKNKEKILKWGLENINACFQPTNKNEIAKRIRRAVVWYSKGVDAESAEESFVNLAIALETLLIGSEGSGPYSTTGSITQRLRERVAFLLGDDFDNRMEIGRITRDLYGLRSAIIHRGEKVELERLAQMDELVTQVILVFLQHGFRTWHEFQEWIAQRKFGEKSL